MNFIWDINEEITKLTTNILTEFFIMGNFNCIGQRQAELLHLWYSGLTMML